MHRRVAAAVLRSSHASSRIIDSTDLQKIHEQAICCELYITTSIIVSKLLSLSLFCAPLLPVLLVCYRTYVWIKKVVYVYKYPLN